MYLCSSTYIERSCLVELEHSQLVAEELEGRMKSAEQERRELEEAQRAANEARIAAEAAAHMEKEERERKVQCRRTWLYGDSPRRVSTLDTSSLNAWHVKSQCLACQVSMLDTSSLNA